MKKWLALLGLSLLGLTGCLMPEYDAVVTFPDRNISTGGFNDQVVYYNSQGSAYYYNNGTTIWIPERRGVCGLNVWCYGQPAPWARRWYIQPGWREEYRIRPYSYYWWQRY